MPTAPPTALQTSLQTTVQWQNAQDRLGCVTKEFRISRDNKRDITGALWLPESPQADRTLICFGHGASGDRYQAPISELAHRFIEESHLPVLSIDGPVHGLRQVHEGGRKEFFPEFQREQCIVDMTDDWNCAIAEIQALAEVGKGKLAYFGLSMGSLFGIPLIASRDDVIAATLGLVGIQPEFPHGDEIKIALEKITCPVLFLMQLEDELFNREACLAAFDGLASANKRIHANPGLHPEVPSNELDFSFNFLNDFIKKFALNKGSTDERNILDPIAD